MVYLRDAADFTTLDDVANKIHDPRQSWTGSSTDVKVLITEIEEHLADAAEDGATEPGYETQQVGTVRFGQHETRLDNHGLQRLAQHYEIPYKFLQRVSPEEQQYILDNRIQRTADEALTLRYNETGISEAYKFTESRFEPQDLVHRILEQGVMPEDSLVLDWWANADDFRLDVITPEGFDRYIGGDPRVGDLTHGGLRFGQDRKRNLVPWVQTLLFRRVCTNGMEIPNSGLRVEGRGASADDILQMLMGEANRALTNVMQDIQHFYDMRQVRVEDDRTGLFRRMAQEAGLADRVVGEMENTLADGLQGNDHASMFDLLNHITNQANDPNIRHNMGLRRRLERAGGGLVIDQARRCGNCHHRLD